MNPESSIVVRFETDTRMDHRVQQLKASLAEGRRLTVCTWLSLGDFMLAFERLGVACETEGIYVSRYYSADQAHSDTDRVEGVVVAQYEGQRVRVEGLFTEREGSVTIVEHSDTVLPLLKLAEEINENPPGAKVYHMDGDWKDPKPIIRSLAGYGWDSVYVPVKIAGKIESEARTFFANGETYREMGLPHRRGFLFTGPPGCGKTSFARALAADNGVGFVLVTSVAARREGPALQLRKAFEMAARIAPAVLCLEDVDGLVEGVTRNELLNQLDGLGRGGDGVLVVATTNYPERLDAALTERPARFDEKWVIRSPGLTDRRGYLEWRLAKSDRRVGTATLERVAKETAGLTYAMLQDATIRAITASRLGGQELDAALIAAVAETKAQVAASKRLAGDAGLGFLQED